MGLVLLLLELFLVCGSSTILTKFLFFINAIKTTSSAAIVYMLAGGIEQDSLTTALTKIDLDDYYATNVSVCNLIR